MGVGSSLTTDNQFLTELINNKGFCRTALATPDMLITSGMKSDLNQKNTNNTKSFIKAFIFKINDKQQW